MNRHDKKKPNTGIERDGRTTAVWKSIIVFSLPLISIVMFDKLTNRYLLTDSAGRIVFFPCGNIGKGYVITTKQKERNVRRFMSAQWIFLILLFILFWTPKIIIISLSGYVLQFFVWKKILLRGVERSSMEYSRQGKDWSAMQTRW